MHAMIAHTPTPMNIETTPTPITPPTTKLSTVSYPLVFVLPAAEKKNQFTIIIHLFIGISDVPTLVGGGGWYNHL